MTQQSNNEPLAQREQNLIKSDILNRGCLKNGNPSGDFSKAPRCGAKSKRTGNPCLQPAMANGKCRLHGGKSTGPKTSVGLKRSQKANWKHGSYSTESKEKLQEFKRLTKLLMNPSEVLGLSSEGIESQAQSVFLYLGSSSL